MIQRASFVVALLALSTPLFAERISVMIQLDSAPAVEAYLSARSAAGKDGASALRVAVSAARSEIAVVESEQQRVVDRIEMLGHGDATVLFRVQRVFNGVAVDIDDSQLDALRALPGVKSVEPLPIVKMANTSSVPLVGGPDVWRALAPNGATGKNIKVGVIDTGLDYIHKDFGGSGDYTGNTGTRTSLPLNDKFAGGTDLAGDDYDASASDATKRIPHPDGDPMDCAGHGSHVAGTIAGYGVTKDNNTYTGRYDVPFDPSVFSIGPGVAPEAKLYSIRVFGCGGSTGLVTPALEWALDPNKDGDFSDRMDVINMSLGGDFGVAHNSNTVAADNLAKAGTVVVASAGNSGDTYYITGSPATGDHVLSVAASVDASEPADGLRIDAPSSIAGLYVTHHSVNYPWLNRSATSGTLARPNDQTSGCAAFSTADKAILNGKIALLDWTDADCGSAARVTNATAAGAKGVVFRYTKNDLDIAIAGTTTTPSTIVAKDTGDLLLANLGSGVTATLSGDFLGAEAVITPGNTDLLSSFSSRGPRFDDNGIKPEITAPGQSIWSVRALSGFRGTSLSGTSMAAPHVTGAVALLRQIHPDWTADELKALAMNTANHDLFTGQNHTGARYSVSRIGAGRLDVASASRSKAFQTVSDPAIGAGGVGISFGAPEVAGTASLSRTVKVVNRSANPITYNVAYDAGLAQPGVTFVVPSSVTVPGNGSATYTVQMNATASAMRHNRDATLTTTQPAAAGATRSWISEASGWVTLTASGQETLRLPVFAAPRPASTMNAVEKTIDGSASGTRTLHLTGTTLATGGSTPEDVNAVVSAYELVQARQANPAIAPQLNILYTGISSDYAAQKAAGKGVADSTLYFAIVTAGPWTSPEETSFRIDIDTNGDGVNDFLVVMGDLATFSNSANDPSDVYISIVCTEAGSNCKRTGFTNVVDPGVADLVTFNSNVIVFPVRAADIGLTSAKTAITYRIQSGTSLTRPVDALPRATYDVANPGLSFAAAQSAPFGFVDAASNTITATFDKNAFLADKSRGILLVHHHNTTAKHAEVITFPSSPHGRSAAK